MKIKLKGKFKTYQLKCCDVFLIYSKQNKIYFLFYLDTVQIHNGHCLHSRSSDKLKNNKTMTLDFVVSQ